MSKTRYIFSVGEIKRKDNSIAFRNKNEWFYIPVKSTREIYFLNEVSLNTRFLNFISKSGIILHFFSYYGYYVGTFYPKRYLISGDLTVRQSLIFIQKRLIIAKSIVKAIALNIRDVLYHYYRHGKKDLKNFLDWLKKDALKMIEKSPSINNLLFIEGLIWNRFYENFKYFLPSDFLISKRVKRPPDNPMNALIGFGNSLLYTKTITMLYHTHLNQSISFLHEPREGRFSLSLDISEAFKPIIVFRTIFELVNKKSIQIEKHFRKDLNYSLLNENGKKIFIQAFENRLNEKFKHSALNRFVSYQTAIKLDGYKLIKFIIENKFFEPFSLRKKR